MDRRWFAPLVLAVVPPALAVAESFPYSARVTVDGTYVRSGPGNEYYPTAKLAAGCKVEVYRHDAGDWCAIRPPEGSFSWVPAKYLKLGRDGVAEVLAMEVPARVGSHLSDVRDVVQVRLRRGETVAVLDTKEFIAGEEPGTWYKIAPPAGEFRWIAAAKIKPDAGSAPPSTLAAAVSRPLSAEECRRALDELELELAKMLAEEPSVWEFQELRPRAESLVKQAQTPVDQNRARKVLSRIEHSEDVKGRYLDVARRRNDSRLPPPQAPTFEFQASPPPDGRFDAHGRLARFVSPKVGAPRYALIDEQGNVQCFVTPAPGVNMEYYLNRVVAVSGIRGVTGQQNAQHVTAKHVQAIDDTRLR